ncbi:MAG: hypothetical protein ACE37J_12035 [Pikeienuella sp.]|uniref:hypothetical protein n=1 Tax=Pikeienuella sp. TaxID=2831957 RepID=UPI00391C447B
MDELEAEGRIFNIFVDGETHTVLDDEGVNWLPLLDENEPDVLAETVIPAGTKFRIEPLVATAKDGAKQTFSLEFEAVFATTADRVVEYGRQRYVHFCRKNGWTPYPYYAFNSFVEGDGVQYFSLNA